MSKWGNDMLGRALAILSGIWMLFFSLSLISCELFEDSRFPARTNHQMVEFQNHIYIIGGMSTNVFLNDVWRSSDGEKWAQVTSSAGFSPRNGHRVIEFKDALYLIGGEDDGGKKNDVWKTMDGIVWTEVNGDEGRTKFSDRSSHEVIMFEDKLYLIGGLGGIGFFYNDVWVTSDGGNWAQVNTHNTRGGDIFSARYGHQLTVLNDAIYLYGGFDSGLSSKNDIWISKDGASWTQSENTSPFTARYLHQSAWMGNKIFLVGGITIDGEQNDVWQSEDGVNWVRLTPSASFPIRDGFRLVAFKDSIYLSGGAHLYYKNDVWRTQDGITWEELISLHYNTY